MVTPEGQLTLRPYAEFLGRPYYSRTIGHSFLVSGLVTAASLLVAAPLAWIVARIAMPGAFLLRTLAILPLVSPPFIGAYSWILLLAAPATSPQAFQAWGIRLPTVYGMHGIVLALTLNLYPLVFLVLLSGLRTMDHSLEEAAAGLGARRGRVFRTVTAPVLLPSILGGRCSSSSRRSPTSAPP